MSENPWICSCTNLKFFQEFLQQYSSLIIDSKELMCSNFDSYILETDFPSLCFNSSDPLKWVVLIEAILLLLIIYNFIRDVVRYRRDGRLPWLARNLCWSAKGGRWKPKLGEFRRPLFTYKVSDDSDSKSSDIKSTVNKKKEKHMSSKV